MCICSNVYYQSCYLLSTTYIPDTGWGLHEARHFAWVSKSSFQWVCKGNRLIHTMQMRKLNLPMWVGKENTQPDTLFETPNPVLSTNQQGRSVLMPHAQALPVNDNWPVNPLSFRPEGALLEVITVSPCLCFSRTYIHSIVPGIQSIAITHCWKRSFSSHLAWHTIKYLPCFPWHLGHIWLKVEGKKQSAAFILQKEENHRWAEGSSAHARRPQPHRHARA